LRTSQATGSQLLEVTLAEPHPAAARELAAFSVGTVKTSEDGMRLWTPARNEAGLAVAALRVLDAAGALVDDITVHRPSLDDVFAVLTGATMAPHVDGAEVPA
jgi:ABC-2 type transport system ATP-binding protein